MKVTQSTENLKLFTIELDDNELHRLFIMAKYRKQEPTVTNVFKDILESILSLFETS